MTNPSISKELAPIEPPRQREMSAFSGAQAFENAQRMAKALASSDLVPQTYRGNLANCIVALEVAQRTGSSALAVMQNLNIIHGRPSWSSQYVIAALNSCGRFAPLKFRMTGEGMKRSCVAWTSDRDGEVLEGPEISMDMAKAEGWLEKAGSKWKTMPELMLRYRAAAFFGRLYAPEILMGMKSEDEVFEQAKDVTPGESVKSNLQNVQEKIKSKKVKTMDLKVETATNDHGAESIVKTQLSDLKSEAVPPAADNEGEGFF